MYKLAVITLIMFSHSISIAKSTREIKFIGSELLGRPTANSVTLNALATADLEVYITYGTESGTYQHQTDTMAFAAETPIEMTVDGLLPNTRYYYRMCYRKTDENLFIERDEHSFHTQRSRGSAFTFAVHFDPHMDQQSDSAIYERTCLNTRDDKPDFVIDLGDNFMSDKIHEIHPGTDITYESIVDRHLLYRHFYDLFGHSSPLFLVLGNHEGEQGWELDGSEDNMAIWATTARKLYYPNPFPNGFYSGDTTQHEFVGLRENYYAWEWGDALFVVLDPYWYTTTKPGKSQNGWDWTLGHEQYTWFKHALEHSDATFKFVFCHHLVGGGESSRGGIEFAPYYEWGGQNADDSWGFDANRPGWGKPIHQLMVENDVTIFFHGHDHFFAKQDLDGVIYQLGPQPSHPNYRRAANAENYGYVSGDILPNSGHLRVRVSDSDVMVDYVRAYKPEDESSSRQNGEVAYSYTILVSDTTTSNVKFPKTLPSSFVLKQNYPNPFNPSTKITFTLPTLEKTTLEIYNTLGHKVVTLLDTKMNAGSYDVQFDASAFSSGIYFYRLQTRAFCQVKTMVLIK